mgnify:CR=1 FL=1
MNKIILIILGMTLVTYIPRLLPFFIVSSSKLPKKVNRFLKLIPYTALGALIIPGAFTAVPQMPLAAVFGAGFALVYSWLRGGIIVPVFGSVLIVFFMLLIR